MNRFRTLLLTLWLSMICTVVYSHNTLQTQYCGLQDGGTYGMVDNLTYYYNGNQLMRVSDSVEDPSYVGAFNFKDGANTGAEYAYDANGNMVIDYNKGITSITYNTINMPQKITFSDGKTTEYVYSYDGTKLQTKHTTPIPQTSTTTTYSGNLIYENGALKRLLVDGGYVTFNGTTPKYHFYIQDHLGNNRVVADEDGNIEQINHYYPFGGLMADISTNSDAQTYKYNGKELDRMHGLDTYDYGARQHNAATGRWDRMDQLAEENPEVSPYVYCGDNPINAIDIKGLFPKFLITQKSTPFYRADYYTLNLPTVHLLSLVSGVSEKHIRNAQIMQRGFGHYYPLYSSNERGGAITLGNTPDNVSINFTPNFFEDDKSKYNGHGYGQDFYGWMNLLSHEVIHIKHIEECGNEISYLGGFLKDYITYGHDNTPREKEADEGTNNFKAFNKYIDNNYGKNSLYKLFKSDKSDKLKIQTINQWWNEYENETHINDSSFASLLTLHF